MTSKQLVRFATALGPLGEKVLITGFSSELVYYIKDEINKFMPRINFLRSFSLNNRYSKQENLDLYRKNFTHEPIDNKPKPKRVRGKERVYEVTKDEVTVEITSKSELIKHIGGKCKAQNIDMALRMDQLCLGYKIIEVSEEYYEEE